MPLDPDFVAETRGWLLQTAGDLRATRVLLESVPPVVAESTFHSQQSAEKALKGLLTWHGRTFPKTHNLDEISQPCLEIAADLEPVLRDAAGLTKYTWKFRYPGEMGEPTPEETEEALGLARRVHEAIVRELPEEVRP